jgi:hypothetical protein
LPSFNTFASNPGIYGSVLKEEMGVNRHLKLNTMAPERGRRRRVCQSTRRFVWERCRDGSWVLEL